MARREHPTRCPQCRAATFRVEHGYTKPNFRCGNGCTWQSGGDGLPYLVHAENFTGGQTYRDWVGFHWFNGELVSTGNGVYDRKGRWVGPPALENPSQ